MRCVLPFPSRSKSSGFTLIDLMITMAIVGVLAALAFPSYTESLNRGRRAELVVQMLAASQFMERYYTENRKYPNNADLKARFEYVPLEATGSKASYQLDLKDPDPTGQRFAIRATPKGVMEDDQCGSFTLDNFRRKGLEDDYKKAKLGNDKEKASQYCWR